MDTTNDPILIFKTNTDAQSIRLTAHQEYFDSIILVETGEELIEKGETGELHYTFPKKGEQQIAVRFKKDIKNLSCCFYECTTLVKIPEKLFEHCTEVERFDQCFSRYDDRCEYIPESYADFEYMPLQHIPQGLFDKCTKAMSFEECFAHTSIKDIPQGLFEHCTEAVDFFGCFENCYNLQTIPEALFSKCTKAESFRWCFAHSSINGIPQELFKHCTEVEDLSWCFFECSCLPAIPQGLLDKCVKVKHLAGCFSRTNISTIPQGLFDHCPEVEDFLACFYECTQLQDLPQGLFDKCTKAKEFHGCFRNTKIQIIPQGLLENDEDIVNCFKDVPYIYIDFPYRLF